MSIKAETRFQFDIVAFQEATTDFTGRCCGYYYRLFLEYCRRGISIDNSRIGLPCDDVNNPVIAYRICGAMSDADKADVKSVLREFYVYVDGKYINANADTIIERQLQIAIKCKAKTDATKANRRAGDRRQGDRREVPPPPVAVKKKTCRRKHTPPVDSNSGQLFMTQEVATTDDILVGAEVAPHLEEPLRKWLKWKGLGRINKGKEYKKRIERRKLTIEQHIKDLNRWHREGRDLMHIVNNAIKREWQGLYLPSSKKGKVNIRTKSTDDIDYGTSGRI